MTSDEKIADRKLQCNINWEAAKIPALSSGRFKKSEYPTIEEILPSDKSQIIKQAKYIYPLLKKTFNKNWKEKENKKSLKKRRWRIFKT